MITGATMMPTGPAMEMAFMATSFTAVAQDISVRHGIEGGQEAATMAAQLARVVHGAGRDEVVRMNALLGPFSSKVATLNDSMRVASAQLANNDSQRILGEFLLGADAAMRGQMVSIASRYVVSPLVDQMKFLAPSALFALYKDRTDFNVKTRIDIEEAVRNSPSRLLRLRAAFYDFRQRIKMA